MPWVFGGTRIALNHSLTHSILINLFIKVELNTLPLPPLLSITFVASAFHAYVLHILEGTSKAYIFSRHKRVASRKWVLHVTCDQDDGWRIKRVESLIVPSLRVLKKNINSFYLTVRHLEQL